MAIYFVGRLTWATDADNENPSQLGAQIGKMHDNLEIELIQRLLAPSAVKANRAFVDQLGVHLAKTFKRVLARDLTDNKSRVTLINAALMLPPVAKLRQEAIGDLLVYVLRDPKQHDAVKLYAAKALGEFFPAKILSVSDDPKDPATKRRFERDTERLAALTEFIDRKGRPLPADPQEREAIGYMRREAVISLARIGVPALAALQEKECGRRRSRGVRTVARACERQGRLRAAAVSFRARGGSPRPLPSERPRRRH